MQGSKSMNFLRILLYVYFELKECLAPAVLKLLNEHFLWLMELRSGLALAEAKIHFDPDVIDSNQLIETILDAGFGADLISSGDDTNKVHLKVQGLGSLEDATLIQLALEATKGVNHVEVDAVGQKITVSYDLDLTGPRLLIRCIEEAGQNSGNYRPSLYTPPRCRETERHHDIRVYRDQFIWSCLFSVPVCMFSMVLPMFSPFDDWLNVKLYNNLRIGMLLRWAFCTPVQFIVGWSGSDFMWDLIMH